MRGEGDTKMLVRRFWLKNDEDNVKESNINESG